MDNSADIFIALDEASKTYWKPKLKLDGTPKRTGLIEVQSHPPQSPTHPWKTAFKSKNAL